MKSIEAENLLRVTKEAYDKYHHLLPVRDLTSIDKTNLDDITKATTYYLYLNRESLLKNTKVDTENLRRLLDSSLNNLYDEESKYISKNGQGLSFLNSFVKENILRVTIKGKGQKTLVDKYDDIHFLNKVVNKAVSLSSDLSLQSLMTISKLISVQVVSNFRPLSSAYILYRYSIMDKPDRKSFKYWIPSEGWLGRVLSSYYLAYRYPNININYTSTDPSGDVCLAFDRLKKFLCSMNKLDNWEARVLQQGSEVKESDFYRTYGEKFDVIFTSPPYGLGFEKYKDSYHVDAMSESGELVELRDNGRLIPEDYEFDCGVNVTKLKCGDKFIFNGSPYIFISKRSGGQSRENYNTTNEWCEIFFRGTVKNAVSSLANDGYVIWNVANVRSHKTLESDVIRICQEEGLKLVDTLKYKLSRVPGGVKNPDGTVTTIRELKADFEPVFVFQRI